MANGLKESQLWGLLSLEPWADSRACLARAQSRPLERFSDVGGRNPLIVQSMEQIDSRSFSVSSFRAS